MFWSQVMRSLQKVFSRVRSRNLKWPKEFFSWDYCSFYYYNVVLFMLSVPQVVAYASKTKESASCSFDPRMWLQSDNTVKECRNTYAARIMSSLTMAGVWSTSSQHFLDVGHTHEDVDGVLSLCKAAIDSSECLQTPHDLMGRLRDKLSPLFHSRGVDFDVELVTTATCKVSFVV